jgi:TM2 domain-containing membrane protein YozV
MFCTACAMPHHEDCYRENGGCTVFGCKCAPADDPKLQVSQSDLLALSMPAQPYAGTQPQSPMYAHSGYGGQSAAPAPARGPSSAPYTYSPSAMPLGYQYAASPLLERSQKSRSAFIFLGVFLGALGIHNFYAGYAGRGVGQLCLTALTLGYLGIISWLWAIVEVCVVQKDSAGLEFS